MGACTAGVESLGERTANPVRTGAGVSQACGALPLGRADRSHLRSVPAFMPAVWWPDAHHCLHHEQCRHTPHPESHRSGLRAAPHIPGTRPLCGMTVMRWQLRERKSGRTGILQLNRHQTTRSTSTSTGDKKSATMKNGTSYVPGEKLRERLEHSRLALSRLAITKL
jgi:hypothetical protein